MSNNCLKTLADNYEKSINNMMLDEWKMRIINLNCRRGEDMDSSCVDSYMKMTKDQLCDPKIDSNDVCSTVFFGNMTTDQFNNTSQSYSNLFSNFNCN